MKLAATETPIQVSSDQLNTSKFGIGDPGIIIRHMTKTLYSNPIQSIVREIMSNGRDSHIETKKTNVPIRVKLPTKNNPTWEVRDWGPGIDPDRFKNVYQQFGKSTKRGNNKESGGFGVGAKTPWAYTDTFTVTTIAKEGSNLVKRFYACVMGEDATGVEIAPAVIIDADDVNEPEEDRGTGTIVSLNVKLEDIERFVEETISMSEFWKVRPELYGRDPLPTYKNHGTLYSGTNWRIIQSDQWHYNRQSFVCIDGIPYPFNHNSFISANKDVDDEVNTLLNSFSFVWNCNVGELELSLNREQLIYTARTCDALMTRINVIMKELKIKLEEKIKGAVNLWDAHVKWIDIRDTFRYGCPIKNVEWQGHKLDKPNFQVATDRNTGAQAHTYSRKDRKGEMSLRHHQSHYLSPALRTKLVFCDEDKLDTSKIRRLMMEDKTIFDVIVVKPNNVGPDGGAYKPDPAWDTVKAAIHFDLLNPTMISSIAKIEREKRQKDANGVLLPPKAIVKAYQYVANRNKFVDEPADLKGGAGIYVEVFRGEFVNADDMIFTKALLHMDSSTVIYGIPQRFADNLGKGWVSAKKTFKDTVDGYLQTISVPDINKMLALKTLLLKENYLACSGSQKFFNYKTVKDVLGDDHAIYKLYALLPAYNKFLKVEANVSQLQNALTLVKKDVTQQLTGDDKEITDWNEEAKKLTLLMKLVYNHSDWQLDSFLKENKKHIVDFLQAFK